MADIMSELAREVGADGAPVRWNTYEAGRAQQLREMDEALFEVAHLVADPTRVDGTVVMTERLEILGFGVEIAGELPEVLRVARARDLEGADREWVRTDRVSTRHRPLIGYARLCGTRLPSLSLKTAACDSSGGTRMASPIGNRSQPGYGKCNEHPIIPTTRPARGD
jgi:hypothetical protein